MLVVIFIIALLSSMLYINTKDYEERAALRRSAQQLAQDLREVEEMAMGAQAVDCGGGKSTRIFGVYFKQLAGIWGNTYTIFAECDFPPNYLYSGAVVEIRKVSLEEGIDICNVNPPPPVSKLSVVFGPPDPIVRLNNSTSPVDATIELCLKSDTSVTRTIKVNTAGRIEVE